MLSFFKEILFLFLRMILRFWTTSNLLGLETVLLNSVSRAKVPWKELLPGPCVRKTTPSFRISPDGFLASLQGTRKTLPMEILLIGKPFLCLMENQRSLDHRSSRKFECIFGSEHKLLFRKGSKLVQAPPGRRCRLGFFLYLLRRSLDPWVC